MLEGGNLGGGGGGGGENPGPPTPPPDHRAPLPLYGPWLGFREMTWYQQKDLNYTDHQC